VKAPGKSLGVLIIARKNSQSAHMLFKTLEDHFNVEIVNATTPSDLNDSNFYPAKNVETLEMAISISHHRARTRALTLGYEWTLILEEDAIVNFDYFQIRLLISSIEQKFSRKNIPIGIHLFPEQFGILRHKRGARFLRILYLPDGAMGYLLNLKGVKRAVADFVPTRVEIADWPRSLRKNIIWFAPRSSLVLHPDVRLVDTESATQIYRDIRSRYSRPRKFLTYRVVPLLFIRVGARFNLSFGTQPITSEKIRSIKLNF
jgi:hypothetical protein